MKFKELEDLVYSYRNPPWAYNTKFGCDCGCGGDLFTVEEWDKEADIYYKAKEELIKLGIDLNDE
jgi:hypothetical protein